MPESCYIFLHLYKKNGKAALLRNLPAFCDIYHINFRMCLLYYIPISDGINGFL